VVWAEIPLVNSINTVYAPLAVKVGLDKVVALADAAGMRVGALNCFAAGKPCDSYALGIPVAPLFEATAYGAFVRHGVAHEPNSILDVKSAEDGDVFDNGKGGTAHRVMSQRVADQVVDVMREVVDHGTGTAARQPEPVAGKTGTTDNFTNAWFTGCTSSLCISVWMGYNKEFSPGGTPHEMRDVESVRGGVFGGTLPARIFARAFDNYRAILERRNAPTPSASPTSHTAPRSTPTATVSATPTPTRPPTPVGPSPSASPSESPSRTSLLPTPP